MDIEIQDVSYDYVGGAIKRPALRDISLRIASHEFVAIVGPSGCGKSTLLNLLAGFLMPTAGAILANGRPITGPCSDRMMIFQQSALFPFYTVAENVEYGLKARGIGQQERRKRSQQILESVGLWPFANGFPKDLSGGMRKLAELARALVLRPPILLFDESLDSLDALKRTNMQHLFQELWLETRPTVVWVTHDLEEAIFMADRVVLMSSHPGSIREAKKIPLPLPRTEEMRMSPDFQNLRRELFQSLLAGESLQEVAS